MAETNQTKPFGSYPPSAFQSWLMAMGHRMPDTWGGRRGASFIRSVMIWKKDDAPKRQRPYDGTDIWAD